MYRLLYWLLLRHLPAEGTHRVAFAALRMLRATPGLGALLAWWGRLRDPDLGIDALGLRFPGPLGLAAGFDKDGRGVDALLALGFAFVEVGTVTGQAQPGNPRPRMFRLPRDHALLNRLGFNNQGAAAAAARLARRRHRGGVVGVNIGKTKRVDEAEAIADYVTSTTQVAPVADYLVVNVSSPNTPGLRDLQSIDKLRPLLQAVRTAADRACPDRRVPLLVKIAPDLADADVDAVAALALELGLDGLVATNTTISRAGLTTPAAEVERLGAGGISGRPVAERSRQVLRRLRAAVGPDLVIISVGGIEHADDVAARLTDGATLCQAYTGFVYGGPGWARAIHRGLTRRRTRR
ncbi:MAG: quinone-dependent dihydroorotate dehydrogenase [Kofleriaceae bacterium]|nr:quinone-dependent dihydroorotate dehydrogenase [Kofleriaceae bacterium]MBP9204418.1 quinone-dependent dihydroorotate dehydrogenase [Kofleriaceae bacterium]